MGKTFRDLTHFRNENMRALAEALIAELAHEHAEVPPVPIPYDLDTAAMLLGVSRRKLMPYLQQNPGKYTYKVNKLTRQRLLYGEDIKRLHEELIEQRPTDAYDPRAKNIPAVKRRLASVGLATGGSDEAGTS